jgi:hypothetical protein
MRATPSQKNRLHPAHARAQGRRPHLRHCRGRHVRRRAAWWPPHHGGARRRHRDAQGHVHRAPPRRADGGDRRHRVPPRRHRGDVLRQGRRRQREPACVVGGGGGVREWLRLQRNRLLRWAGEGFGPHVRCCSAAKHCGGFQKSPARTSKTCYAQGFTVLPLLTPYRPARNLQTPTSALWVAPTRATPTPSAPTPRATSHAPASPASRATATPHATVRGGWVHSSCGGA